MPAPTQQRLHFGERGLWRNTWLPVVLPFLAAAVLIALPARARKAAPVQVEAYLSEFSFEVGGDRGSSLLAECSVRSLRLTGFKALRFEAGELERSGGAHPAVSGAGQIAGGPDARITIGPSVLGTLRVMSGAHVTIESSARQAGTLTIRVPSGGFRGEVTVGPTINLTDCRGCGVPGGLALPDGAALRIRSPRDQILTFEAGPGALTLDLDPGNQPFVPDAQVPVTGVVEFYGRSPGSLQPFPTILRESRITVGTASAEKKLTSSTMMALRAQSDLSLHLVDADRGVHVRVAGPVESARAGPETGPLEELVPSWLEWFHTQSPLTRVVTDVTLLGSTVLAIITRLKVARGDRTQ